MVDIIVPSRMPTGLVSRTTSRKTRVQNGRPVSAGPFGTLELAIQHLCGARRFSVPCCTIFPHSSNTIRSKFATEPYASTALFWAVLIGTGAPTDVTIDFTTDEAGDSASVVVNVQDEQYTIASATLEVTGYSGNAAMDPADAWETYEIAKTGSNMKFASFGVIPLPFVEPHYPGGVIEQ